MSLFLSMFSDFPPGKRRAQGANPSKGWENRSSLGVCQAKEKPSNDENPQTVFAPWPHQPGPQHSPGPPFPIGVSFSTEVAHRCLLPFFL